MALFVGMDELTRRLHMAVLQNNIAEIKTAIAEGANVNHIYPNGNTFLREAISQQCFECAILLINNGLVPKLNYKSSTPFIIELMHYYSYVYSVNSNPHPAHAASAKRSLMHWKAFFVEILNMLPPNQLKVRDDTGMTPYMHAVRLNLPEEIKEEILIKTEHNPLNRNIYGRRSINYMPRGAAGGKRRKSRRSRRNRHSTRR
jgi:hypothetical protein